MNTRSIHPPLIFDTAPRMFVKGVSNSKYPIYKIGTCVYFLNFGRYFLNFGRYFSKLMLSTSYLHRGVFEKTMSFFIFGIYI